MAKDGQPNVAVIVLNYNGKDDTLRCVDSLKAQTLKPKHIVVVDNGSSDGSWEAFQDLPVVKIRLWANGGFAGGMNAGLVAALHLESDYVLLLNNDTEAHPKCVRELVRAAQGRGVGMVGAKIFYYASRRIWFVCARNYWWAGWFAHEHIREVDWGQFEDELDTDYITGCCLLVKREVIEKIGYLDESFFFSGEDVDWCERAKRAGYRLVVNPKAIVWHRVSATAGRSWFKMYHKFVGILKLMRRYAKPWHWAVFPVGLAYKILHNRLTT